MFDWWMYRPAFRERHQKEFGKTDLFDGFEEELMDRGQKEVLFDEADQSES